MSETPSPGSVPTSLESITQAVLSFVRADNWSESKRIVEGQPNLLLTYEADLALGNLLMDYADDANTTRLLEAQRTLLRRCRTEGIEAAFADKLRPAMPDIPPDLMARLSSVQSEEELTELLTQHPELLPVVVAMQQAAQQQNTPDPRQELANKLMIFVRAETWNESKAYLAQHPELLTDEAFEVLSVLIQAQENQDAIRTLTQHRDLLAFARQKGLDKAFADLMARSNADTNALIPLMMALIACDSPAAVLELAAQQPTLLSDEVDALLQQEIAPAHAQGSDEGKAYAQHVEQRHQTLRQLRQMMDETGMSAEEVVQAVRTRPESPAQLPSRPSQQLWKAIQAFGTASSEAERKRIVEQERDLLLTDAALQVFADLLEQYKEDAGAIDDLTDHRDLLRRCQKEGIDAAFVHRVRTQESSSAPLSDELRALWEEIQALTRVTDMPRRIELCHRALTLVERDSQPQLWATLQGTLGNSYAQNPLGKRANNIEEAITCYQQALSVHTRQALPLEWANTINNLANAYSDRIKGEPADNIEQAINCYQQALSVRTRQAS